MPASSRSYTQSLRADWTTSEDGHTNSSERFEELAEAIAKLLDGDVYRLAQGPTGRRFTSRLILAQLAHVHGLVPSDFKGNKTQ